MEIDVLAQSESDLRFNFTRCRYPEMYESLGLSGLGAVLSCQRDDSKPASGRDEES